MSYILFLTFASEFYGTFDGLLLAQLMLFYGYGRHIRVRSWEEESVYS